MMVHASSSKKEVYKNCCCATYCKTLVLITTRSVHLSINNYYAAIYGAPFNLDLIVVCRSLNGSLSQAFSCPRSLLVHCTELLKITHHVVSDQESSFFLSFFQDQFKSVYVRESERMLRKLDASDD